MIIIFIFHIRQTLLESWKKDNFSSMSLFNLNCYFWEMFFYFFCHITQHVRSWPGIKPAPSAVEAQGLNHWTPREVLKIYFFFPNKELNKNEWAKLLKPTYLPVQFATRYHKPEFHLKNYLRSGWPYNKWSRRFRLMQWDGLTSPWTETQT